MSREESLQNWMKGWSDLINKGETHTDDFWVETPIGNFKNPKFIPNENDEMGEINITIQYDEWDKNQNKDE